MWLVILFNVVAVAFVVMARTRKKPTAIRFDPIAARRIIRTCHRLDEDEPLDLKTDSQAAAIYRTWLVKGA